LVALDEAIFRIVDFLADNQERAENGIMLLSAEAR
jgi:hypothetical protein